MVYYINNLQSQANLSVDLCQSALSDLTALHIFACGCTAAPRGVVDGEQAGTQDMEVL